MPGAGSKIRRVAKGLPGGRTALLTPLLIVRHMSSDSLIFFYLSLETVKGKLTQDGAWIAQDWDLARGSGVSHDGCKQVSSLHSIEKRLDIDQVDENTWPLHVGPTREGFQNKHRAKTFILFGDKETRDYWGLKDQGEGGHRRLYDTAENSWTSGQE